MPNYDVIIIGAGQSGPSLVQRLVAAGRNVAIIERKLFGGTCVNTGCINQSITNPTFTRRIEEKASERRSGFSLECFASCAWTKRPCF